MEKTLKRHFYCNFYSIVWSLSYIPIITEISFKITFYLCITLIRAGFFCKVFSQKWDDCKVKGDYTLHAAPKLSVYGNESASPGLQRWGVSVSHGWGQLVHRSSHTLLSCHPSPAPATLAPHCASAGSPPGWERIHSNTYIQLNFNFRNQNVRDFLRAWFLWTTEGMV